ncbi:MAG: hypothetical protein GY953_54455 [bacterium]|nr:hypothetical protein [bacterium]
MRKSLRLVVCALAAAALLPAASYYVTIAGLGGEEDYEQRFAGWAGDLDKLFRESAGDVHVHTLQGGEATRDRVREVLNTIAGQASAGDRLALMLIGHGSFDGHDYKINLPGPDITATELAQLLDSVEAGRQLVANMTSASGGSMPALQRQNRTVITATKSGTERNAVVFARYWVSALGDAAADTDKNEVISALEAYQYARRKTTDFYVTQKRLATEHALLEDTGAGAGVREPSPDNGQGLKAAQFSLLRIGKTQRASADPAKRELLDRKESLEQQIDKLKYEKAAIPFEEYQEELTALLIELARTQAELDQ